MFRSRISRQLATAPDLDLTAIYEDLLAPGHDEASGRRLDADVVIPMAPPMDITVDELAIESYYPAYTASATYFRP